MFSQIHLMSDEIDSLFQPWNRPGGSRSIPLEFQRGIGLGQVSVHPIGTCRPGFVPWKAGKCIAILQQSFLIIFNVCNDALNQCEMQTMQRGR